MQFNVNLDKTYAPPCFEYIKTRIKFISVLIMPTLNSDVHHSFIDLQHNKPLTKQYRYTQPP